MGIRRIWRRQGRLCLPEEGATGAARQGRAQETEGRIPFLVIRGTFQIQGYWPDGDSIRFQADDEASWQKLSGPPVGLNGRRHAQLRLEAIDTLETHQ